MKVNKRWLDLLSTYIETVIESFLLLTDVYNTEIYNVPFRMV